GALNLVQALSGHDVTVALLAEDGDVITSTQPVEGDSPRVLPLLPDGWLAGVTDNAPGTRIEASREGGRELVVVQSFTVPPGSFFSGNRVYVEHVVSLASADSVLNWLRFSLVLGILVGTLIGVVAGMLLTRA